MPAVKKQTQEEIGRICLLYRSGRSLREVEEQLDIPYSRVYSGLKRGNVRTRTRSEGQTLAYRTGRRSDWNGGRKLDKNGYVLIHLGDDKYRPEHCLIWEQHNGPIPAGWHVHHINGVKDDNRIKNLQAMPSKKHAHIIELMQEHIQHLERELAELRTDVRALERQRSRTT